MSSALGVGMLGLGTVGQAVAAGLERRASEIEARTGRPVLLRRVAVRDPSRSRRVTPSTAGVGSDVMAVVEAPEVDVVVEVMGGEEPALSAVRRAMALGKPVVTANKLLVARHGMELITMSARQDVPFLFEAAVGGAIPIIRPIRESLASDRILAVMGILNGTTNYVLTRMAGGASMAEALRQAQELGYAEADPEADLSGMDSAHKLAVLASLAFGAWLYPEEIPVSGVKAVEAHDIQYARELGLTVKLLAHARSTTSGVEAWVAPAMLPANHPLSQVLGVNNAILLVTEAAGELMFYGPGAGGDPTAAAILGDVMDVARRFDDRRARRDNGHEPGFVMRRMRTPLQHEAQHRFYIRLAVADRPGVLATIADVFGRHGVSIESVIQKGRGEEPVDLVFVTHDAPEAAMSRVVHEVSSLAVVSQAGFPFRVVGG